MCCLWPDVENVAGGDVPVTEKIGFEHVLKLQLGNHDKLTTDTMLRSQRSYDSLETSLADGNAEN